MRNISRSVFPGFHHISYFTILYTLLYSTSLHMIAIYIAMSRFADEAAAGRTRGFIPFSRVSRSARHAAGRRPASRSEPRSGCGSGSDSDSATTRAWGPEANCAEAAAAAACGPTVPARARPTAKPVRSRHYGMVRSRALTRIAPQRDCNLVLGRLQFHPSLLMSR